MWSSFFRTLAHLDTAKAAPIMAIRNSLAVALPLAAGLALHDPLSGVILATGALNVSFSDGIDSYQQRAKRMMMWSLLGGAAVFLGSIFASRNTASVVLAAGWAFCAGMLLAVGTQAGDLGVNTLVTLVVFAARPMSPWTALGAGLLVITGGLIQSGFSVILWPFQSGVPQRQALGRLYGELSHRARSYATSTAPPGDSTAEVLKALGNGHNVESERYLMLLDQAERIRLSIFVLARLQARACPEECLQRTLTIAADVLTAVSSSLGSGRNSREIPIAAKQLQALVDGIHTNGTALLGQSEQIRAEIESEIDALAGRLRSAIRLTTNATVEGMAEFDRREHARPIRLRLETHFETLRANLHLNSAVFRHAIRLAACIALGDAIGRGIDWQRSYWIPMTVAVVLKPDFTGTFTRGVLRLLGTFGGLVLATLLFHALPNGVGIEVLLLALLTFVLRYLGPTNYGIFSAAVAGYVVLLLALTGVSPAQVIAARGLNTAAGGILALLSYAVWPTWESTQTPEVFAGLFDKSRNYFRLVAQIPNAVDVPTLAQLDNARLAWRQARSAAEASVDRVKTEPITKRRELGLLNSILASSHNCMHAVMAIEAVLLRERPQVVPREFQSFAYDVELTFYFLAAALRGSAAALETLPSLRKDHNQLEHVKQGFLAETSLLDETDRLTNSLNTVREQIASWQAT